MSNKFILKLRDGREFNASFLSKFNEGTFLNIKNFGHQIMLAHKIDDTKPFMIINHKGNEFKFCETNKEFYMKYCDMRAVFLPSYEKVYYNIVVPRP